MLASLRCVTLVTPVVLAIFGGHCRLDEDCIKSGPVVSGKIVDDNDDDDDDDDLWEGIYDIVLVFSSLPWFLQLLFSILW